MKTKVLLMFLLSTLLFKVKSNAQAFSPASIEPFSNNFLTKVIDFDNDGDDDVYGWTLSTNSNGKLFRNNGNSTFTDVSNETNFPSLANGIAADLDKNGFMDLYYRVGDTLIYTFNNSGVFSTANFNCGKLLLSDLFNCNPSDVGFTELADYNNDGTYDLVSIILNGSNAEINAIAGSLSCTGCGVSFNNNPAILTSITNQIGPVFSFADVNNDGSFDLLIGNGTQSAPYASGYWNYLYSIKLNDGNGNFNLFANSGYNIGRSLGFGTLGEFNNDGRVDILSGTADCCVGGPGGSGNINPIYTFFSNSTGGYTSSTTAITRATDRKYYNTPTVVDLNLDGKQDVVWTDIYAYAFSSSALQCYINNGNSTFTESSAAFGINLGTSPTPVLHTSQLSTVIDLNNDKKPDLNIVSFGTYNQDFYNNNTRLNTIANNSVKLKLIACTGLKEGWGARIAYKTGGIWNRNQHSSYSGANNPFIYLGMGSNSSIDSLVVNWIGGATTYYTNINAGTYFIATENNTCAAQIGASVTPTFQPISQICRNVTESPLPTVSINGINGTWSPAFNTDSSRVYTFTPDSGQCANVTTLNIEVADLSSTIVSANSCNTYTWNGTTYTQSGTYTWTGTNAAGCDSVVTLNLTINQPTAETVNASITEGESYNFNGQNLTTAGTYTATLQNADGCDSLVTLNLTVEPAVEPLNCEISASETSLCLGETAGLNLTSNPSNTIPSYQIGAVTPSGGIVFYDKGNDSNGWRYLEVMPVDYSGPTFYTGCYCSSIEGTTNSLGSGYENSQIWANTNCSIVPFDYSYGGFTGWYLPSVAELTQIYTQLSVNNSFSSGAYWSSNPAPYGSCGIDGGASVLNFSNGSVYSEYRNGYQGSGYARLVRRFLPESTSSILWSTGETTPSISVSPTETTTYSVTVTQGTQTCTSEVTITVNQPTAETVNASITEGETYSFNGQNLTTAGTYTATLLNAAECDSVVTLNLTVNPAPEAGCYATSVMNFVQGQRADATNVTAIRSNAELALGMPEPVVTNVVNFASLGFGGSITLAFEAPIANGDGADIRIDEATWGNNPCNRYPERADVFASQDGVNFVYLGVACQDASFDLGSLSWAQYVRIVDISDLLSFNADADGFDVNGIECLNGAATSLNNDGLVACSLQEIVSYTPGNRKNGTPVTAARSNPANALGTPQNNNTINFTALGFGGTMVGKFDFVVFNQPGNDLRVTETSFGNPSCNNYPEKARVSVSMDNVIWTELGEICQDGEIDLANVNYAQYIKIQDASPLSSNKFNGAADGYDVDAVVVLNNGCGTSSARLAQMDNTTTPDASMSISAFPNPMEDYTIVNFEGLENDADFNFQIMDAAGRVIRNNNIRVSTANPTYLFDASELARGIYQVLISNENGSYIIRLVK